MTVLCLTSTSSTMSDRSLGIDSYTPDAVVALMHSRLAVAGGAMHCQTSDC